MRVVLQRVKEASVFVKEQRVSSIQKGILLFLGIEVNDTIDDAHWLSKKVSQLRLFIDENGLMNKSVIEAQGDILVVSQFTLHAKIKKGKRPSYIRAAKSEDALPLYKFFISELSSLLEKNIEQGKFGEKMQVSIVNDGPITIFIDSKNKE